MCFLPLFSQAIINSTITPNMTFTKTSQKFGQWADSRANTVYGLGFSTEQQLQQVSTRTLRQTLIYIERGRIRRERTSRRQLFVFFVHLQFAEQFKEVKEAARLAREKSQERYELANPGLNIAAPQVNH